MANASKRIANNRKTKRLANDARDKLGLVESAFVFARMVERDRHKRGARKIELQHAKMRDKELGERCCGATSMVIFEGMNQCAHRSVAKLCSGCERI